MAIRRMDHVSVVVDDLAAAKAFFVALGMEIEGEARIAGPAVDRLNALEGIRVDIAMLRVPGRSDGLELTKFHDPPAVGADRAAAPPNALGLRSVMFAVDDLDDTLDRLRKHGATLVDEVVRYEDVYRLCYIRGPEGILIGLAEEIG